MNFRGCNGFLGCLTQEPSAVEASFLEELTVFLFHHYLANRYFLQTILLSLFTAKNVSISRKRDFASFLINYSTPNLFIEVQKSHDSL